MKNFLFYFLLIIAVMHSALIEFSEASSRQIIEQDLDFRLNAVALSEGQMIYSQKLMEWPEWLRRNSSGYLFSKSQLVNPIAEAEIKKLKEAMKKNGVEETEIKRKLPDDPMVNYCPDCKHVEVFEARSAGIINMPIGRFTKDYLHNISTLKKLDPNTLYEPLSTSPFLFEATLEFPTLWTPAFYIAKKSSLLSPETPFGIALINKLSYTSAERIRESAALLNIVKNLDITGEGRIPDVINIQSSQYIKPFATFGTLVTFFYKLGDPSKTLVVNYFVLGVKKKYLSLTSPIDVRKIFLGVHPTLSSSRGIGSGLPNYSKQLFISILNGFSAP